MYIEQMCIYFNIFNYPFKVVGYELKTKNEKIVRNVLLTVMFFTFILGAINLGGKIAKNYNDAKFVEKAKIRSSIKKRKWY